MTGGNRLMATYLLQPLGDAGWEAECGTLPLAVGESQILGRQQHLLIKDRAVSRQHCQLHNKDGQLHLTANSLTHVTWAGTQLTTKLKPGTAGVELAEGDRIHLLKLPKGELKHGFEVRLAPSQQQQQQQQQPSTVPLAARSSELGAAAAPGLAQQQVGLAPKAAEPAAGEAGALPPANPQVLPPPLQPPSGSLLGAAAAGAEGTGRLFPLQQQPTPRILCNQLHISDLQQLVMHLMGIAPRPIWLSMQGQGKPSPLVLLSVPGLDSTLVKEKSEQDPSLLPNIMQLGQPAILQATYHAEVPQQTLTALMTLFPSTLSQACSTKPGRPAKRSRPSSARTPSPAPSAAAAAVAAAAPGSDGGAGPSAPQHFPPEFFAATHQQMAAAGYPMWGLGPEGQQGGAAEGGQGLGAPQAAAALPPGWVGTWQAPAQGGAGSAAAAPPWLQRWRLVAVDCEMVITSSPPTRKPQRFELARTTLVDEEGRVLLDRLSLPDNPVTDYNTRYSGISRETLLGVTDHVADIQRLVLQFVGPDTVLVGHALENDLKALRMVHACCVDTMILFPSPKGPPHRCGLRRLAQQLLGRAIQRGHGQGGHDSAEDAVAALNLAQLKFRHGPTFGTTAEGSVHMLDELSRRGRRVALVGRQEILNQHAPCGSTVRRCSSDAQAVELVGELLRAPQRPDLVFCQLSELFSFMQRHATEQLQAGTSSNVGQAIDTFQTEVCLATGRPWLDTLLAQTDQQVGHLLAQMPSGAVVLLFSGQGNTPLCRVMEGYGPRGWAYKPGVQWAARLASFSAEAAQGIVSICIRADGSSERR